MYLPFDKWGSVLLVQGCIPMTNHNIHLAGHSKRYAFSKGKCLAKQAVCWPPSHYAYKARHLCQSQPAKTRQGQTWTIPASQAETFSIGREGGGRRKGRGGSCQ